MRAVNLAALILASAAAVASAQTPDTSTAIDERPSGTSAEFRIGAIYLNAAERNRYFQGHANAATANVIGGEGLLRGSGIGISGRYIEGGFAPGTDTLVAADANILLGPPAFSLMGGYALRGVLRAGNSIVY